MQAKDIKKSKSDAKSKWFRDAMSDVCIIESKLSTKLVRGKQHRNSTTSRSSSFSEKSTKTVDLDSFDKNEVDDHDATTTPQSAPRHISTLSSKGGDGKNKCKSNTSFIRDTRQEIEILQQQLNNSKPTSQNRNQSPPICGGKQPEKPQPQISPQSQIRAEESFYDNEQPKRTVSLDGSQSDFAEEAWRELDALHQRLMKARRRSVQPTTFNDSPF